MTVYQEQIASSLAYISSIITLIRTHGGACGIPITDLLRDINQIVEHRMICADLRKGALHADEMQDLEEKINGCIDAIMNPLAFPHVPPVQHLSELERDVKELWGLFASIPSGEEPPKDAA